MTERMDRDAEDVARVLNSVERRLRLLGHDLDNLRRVLDVLKRTYGQKGVIAQDHSAPGGPRPQ